MPALAICKSVHKEYRLGTQTISALRGIDFELKDGEFLALVGPSGSGKSTLLNLLGCIDVPTRGEVLIDNIPVNTLSERKRSQVRLRKLGFVFQNFSLIPVLSVFQNVELPLLLQGDLATRERHARVESMIERVGLRDHRHKRPGELSGGQQQRVAIARALVGRPKLIIADEPTANLDHATGNSILELMRELNRSERATVLYSTHDPEMMAFADRRVRMADGKMVEQVSAAS